MDVYAFGISALETVAGRPAEGAQAGDDDLFLEAEEALEDLDDDPDAALGLVDPAVPADAGARPLLLGLLAVVVECTNYRYKQRPTASGVLERIDRVYRGAAAAAAAPAPGGGDAAARTGASRASWESAGRKGLDDRKRFAVAPTSTEFGDVAAQLLATMPPGTAVDAIERVENGYQDEAHEVKVQAIRAQLGDAYDPRTMRQLLFHGTRCRGDVVDNIVQDPDAGFLPLKSGDRTGAIWGDGTYFARDARYSHDYASTLPSGQKQMIVADVMVGRWTLGRPKVKECPIVEGERYTRYNSLVNDVASPSIFVVQHSSQAYPAYVVTYH